MGAPNADFAEEWSLSVAARFWNCTPWELEARPDVLYYKSRALAFRQAENQAEAIAAKIAQEKRN